MDAVTAHIQTLDTVLRTLGPIDVLRVLALRCRALAALADPAGQPPWPCDTAGAIERAASALEASLGAVPEEAQEDRASAEVERKGEDDESEENATADDAEDEDEDEGDEEGADGEEEGEDELPHVEAAIAPAPPSRSAPAPASTEVSMTALRKDQIPVPEGTTHWRAWRVDQNGKQTALSHEEELTEEDEFPVRLLSKSRLRQWWGSGKYTVGFFQLLPTGRRKAFGRSRPVVIKGPGDNASPFGAEITSTPAMGSAPPNAHEWMQMQWQMQMMKAQREEEREERQRAEEKERDERRRAREEAREEAMERDRLELKKLELQVRLGAARGPDVEALSQQIQNLTTQIARMQEAFAEREEGESLAAPSPDAMSNVVNALREVFGPVVALVATKMANDNAGPGLVSAPVTNPYQPRTGSGNGGE